jgi:formylglycine-generating enzyme required for sulfatase activity
MQLKLSEFKFDVVSVNEFGQEIHQAKKIAKEFKQDLGNGITLDLVAIPKGLFMMGSLKTEGYEEEFPSHEVKIKSFFMSKYPVTQAQWRAIASLPKVDRKLDPDPSYFKGNDLPVEMISWLDAVEFCQRLTGISGQNYRLPTEAEWEYACRARTITSFYFGQTLTSKLANYDASFTFANESSGEYLAKTTPVGSFPPNTFGLYDMHGNVREWCADAWHDNYEGAPIDGSAWLDNLTNEYRVLRGGSWMGIPHYCRCAYRHLDILGQEGCNDGTGFRVVLSYEFPIYSEIF